MVGFLIKLNLNRSSGGSWGCASQGDCKSLIPVPNTPPGFRAACKAKQALSGGVVCPFYIVFNHEFNKFEKLF